MDVKRVLQWLRGETVLWVSWVLALATAVVVPPDAGYLDYVDLHTLGMLFSLMAVMAGLQRQGLFFRLGRAMLATHQRPGHTPGRFFELCAASAAHHHSSFFIFHSSSLSPPPCNSA